MCDFDLAKPRSEEALILRSERSERLEGRGPRAKASHEYARRKAPTLPYRASSFIASSNPLSVVGNILSSPMIPLIIPVLWL